MDHGYHYKDYCHPSSHVNHPHHHPQQQQHSATQHPKPGHSGREDFGGLDNDALDFSQLEDFITDDTDGNGSYFADTLANSEASKHSITAQANAQGARDRIVVITSIQQNDPNSYSDVKRSSLNSNSSGATNNGVVANVYTPNSLPHNLPDSPPDSGSEPPYSPTDPGSKSPHQKSNALNGSCNVHELMVHPSIYSSNTNGLLPLVLHDIPQMNSPLQTLGPIHHTSSLVPISPSGTASVDSPVANATLTPLGVVPTTQQPTHVVATGAGSHSMTATLSQESQHQGVPESLSFYTPLQPINGDNSSRSRKRKMSESSGCSNENPHASVRIKQESGEPNGTSEKLGSATGANGSSTNISAVEDEFGFEFNGDSSMFLDSNYQCIKFQPFQENTWHTLADESFKELSMPYYKVDADKGFNFSNADDAFVCQKKNHFQITCHTKVHGEPKYVKTADGYQSVEKFFLHFYGVKVESPNQTIKIEQSQSDRSKKPFHPVLVKFTSDQVVKVTVGRLHFNETTSNNMRKKGKPNPDQRYFYLVVGLHAHCKDGVYPIVAHHSQRIIVRASNPGQFESDVELSWQKGTASDSIYHAGRVGINTDRPEEALVVYGNCKITGQITHPSDSRAKDDITEMDTKAQLNNVQQLRVVRYKYNPEFARLVGLSEEEAIDTGVIAQEVQKVIPEAVKQTGDIDLGNGHKINNFLVVNKERIFMENVGAVKELCKVTGKLETRIDQLEKITRLKRRDSVDSTSAKCQTHAKPKRSQFPSLGTNDILCSNKCVQLLIFLLVLVMAFCLIAMATLYMIEYQKRSSYEFHQNSHYLTNTSHARPHDSQHPGSLGNGRHNSHDGNVHGSSLLYNHSTKSPIKFPAKNSHGEFAKSALGASIHLQEKPSVLGRPLHCTPSSSYLNPLCKMFCCPGRNLAGAGVDYLDVVRKNHVVLPGGLQATTPSPISSQTSTGSQNNRVDVVSSNPVSRNGLDTRRRKRQVHEDTKLLNVPSIHILSKHINQTLGPKYCMMNTVGYHDCASTANRYFASANLTYHIPLSKYWNELNVSLIFNFTSKFEISAPKVCDKVYVQPDCVLDFDVTDTNKVDEQQEALTTSVEKLTKNLYSLGVQVGASPYSHLHLRFSPYLHEVEHLCSLNSSSSKYFEFNFHFYRVCD